MNRREAIYLSLVIGSTSLITSCDFESFPVYSNLPLDKQQFNLIRNIQNSILPNAFDENFNQRLLNYGLLRINDCYEKIEIEKFLKGLSEFQSNLSKEGISFDKLSQEERIKVFEFVTGENPESSESFFLLQLKNLVLEFFTLSEKFQTKYLDYNFVPGFYNGCQNIN